MRHRKNSVKLSRTSSHRRCLFANMVKSLIINERIVTTLPKAKALRRLAEQMVTLAKKNNLSARRRAIADLMIRFNKLTDKEKRLSRNENTKAYNDDRTIIDKLFNDLGPRFQSRNGGYTRILKIADLRAGDGGQKCLIEYISE